LLPSPPKGFPFSLRCLTIELRGSEIDALIRQGGCLATITRTLPLYHWRCTASSISFCGDTQRRLRA
jgi:hypothetical protein